jgi:DNA damage-binding protein 1
LFILFASVCAILQDNKDVRHVKTYEVALNDKDFIEGPWSQNNVDNGAGLLIPVPAPLGGVIIIGEEQIVYCNANSTFKAIPIKQVISCLHLFKFLCGAYFRLVSIVSTLILLPLISVFRQSIIRAYGRVDPDGSRYLLGDNTGILHLLVLTHERER